MLIEAAVGQESDTLAAYVYIDQSMLFHQKVVTF